MSTKIRRKYTEVQHDQGKFKGYEYFCKVINFIFMVRVLAFFLPFLVLISLLSEGHHNICMNSAELSHVLSNYAW